MLGAQNALSLLPFTDVTPGQLDDKDKFNETVVGLLGSFVSTSRNIARGIGQVAEGDVYKGMENMLPSGFKKLMQAIRYKSEGYTNAKGDVLLSPDEISYLDALWQGIGLRSSDIARFQEAQSRKFKTEEFFTNKTAELNKRYTKAYKSKDNAEMRAVRTDFEELQNLRAQYGLKRQPVSNLLKQPREQAKRERNTVGGLQYTSGNREMVERLVP
jgi:hypothetical protein